MGANPADISMSVSNDTVTALLLRLSLERYLPLLNEEDLTQLPVLRAIGADNLRENLVEIGFEPADASTLAAELFPEDCVDERAPELEAVGVRFLVDEQLRTSATDVFAVGDCAEVVTPEGDAFIQQAWYTGKAQGELVAGNVLGGNARYLRGIWFNSAKFLDIEYQTYGRVPNQPDGEHGHLYWEHPGGRKSMRLVHRDGTFVGANVMGMRLRHRVCEAWIKEACPVEHVVEHLHQAMFDPELEATPLPAIRRAFAGGHP